MKLGKSGVGGQGLCLRHGSLITGSEIPCEYDIWREVNSPSWRRNSFGVPPILHQKWDFSLHKISALPTAKNFQNPPEPLESSRYHYSSVASSVC